MAEGAGSHPQCQSVTCQGLLLARGCWPVPKQLLECLAHPAPRCFCSPGSRAAAVPDAGFSLGERGGLMRGLCIAGPRLQHVQTVLRRKRELSAP